MSGDEDFETADEDHGLRFTENTRVPRPPSPLWQLSSFPMCL